MDQFGIGMGLVGFLGGRGGVSHLPYVKTVTSLHLYFSRPLPVDERRNDR